MYVFDEMVIPNSQQGNENSIPPGDDLSALGEDVAAIREMVEEMFQDQEQDPADQEQEPADQEQEPADQDQEQEQADPVIDLTFLSPVDHNLYLSSEVQYANINDVYSIMLSTRNILLLFVLVFFCYKGAMILKSVIYRIFNK